MTEYVRPVSRLTAKELTSTELDSVSGGTSSGPAINTSCVSQISQGGFVVDDSHADRE